MLSSHLEGEYISFLLDSYIEISNRILFLYKLEIFLTFNNIYIFITYKIYATRIFLSKNEMAPNLRAHVQILI
jgi:hypothetical protein